MRLSLNPLSRLLVTVLALTTCASISTPSVNATTSICPGGGTTYVLQTEPGGGTLSAVSGASALDRTSPSNLVQNGDFSIEPANLASSSQPNFYFWGESGRITKTITALNSEIPSWTRSGGSPLGTANTTGTYAFWTKNLPHTSPNGLVDLPADGQSAGRLYFGNAISSSHSPAVSSASFDSEGFSRTNFTITPATGYGTFENPPAVSQNVSLVVGKKYRMHFLQGTENTPQDLGVAALEITGYNRVYFHVKQPSYHYMVEFIATAATTKIKFMSWGHLMVGLGDGGYVTKRKMASSKATITTSVAHGIPAGSTVEIAGVGTNYDGTFTVSSTTSTTITYTPTTYVLEAETTVSPNGTVAQTDRQQLSSELVLDDVIINACTESATPPSPPTATNDSLTSAWDTNQSYTPLSNDTAGTGTSLNSSSLRLCPTAATSPYDGTNCNLSSITVANEGTYTISGSNVVFNPLDTFFGTVSTPVRYVVADGINQYASALITPTVGPKATPDSLVLLPGSTGSFDAITGANGLAAGLNLDTSQTFLCGATETTPNCTKTSVTISGVGTYTLDQSTGVVTLAADASATSGTKTAITYVVKDSTGLTASSTLTPTFPGPPSASPDSSSGGFNQNQTLRILDNDLAGAGGTITINTVFLCSSSETPTSCTQTSVTIANEGTYTVSAGVVTFVPVAGYTGTGTTLKYQFTDSYNNKTWSTLVVTVVPPISAVNDAMTTAWDTNQNYTPVTNDTGTVTSLKLCGTGETSPNCTATSLVVADEGTYTVSGLNVLFDPLPNFFGTAATPARYVTSDSVGQTATALITPTIGPRATPATLSLLAGATASFTTITGSGGLASGKSLTTSKTYLCGSGETAPNCTETSTVIVEGVGTYTLNQSTGVVTLVAFETATVGVKAALTYVVTDSTTLTAYSTLTPTIYVPAPPAPVIPVFPPSALPDISSGLFQKTQSFGILGNDSPSTASTIVSSTARLCGLDQSPFSCDKTTVVVKGEGTFTLDSNGTVTFVPESNFSGVATTIKYQVSDSSAQLTNSTITVTVTPPPSSVANPDTTSNFKGIVQNSNLLLNDKAGDGLTFVSSTLKFCLSSETPPLCSATRVVVQGQGVFQIQSDGNVSFTPEADFVGTATPVPYIVQDSFTRVVSSKYTPTVRDFPKAAPDSSSAAFRTVQTLSLLGNDQASSGSSLIASSTKLCGAAEKASACSKSLIVIPGQGQLQLSADGVVTFIPDANFYGNVDVIEYQITDSSTQVASSTITIVVGPPAVAPRAVDDLRRTPLNVPVSLDAIENDLPGSVEFDKPSLRFCEIVNGKNLCNSEAISNFTGRFNVNTQTGLVTFTPEPGWTGTSKIPYVVKNLAGQYASAVITIIIEPPAYLKLKELAWTGQSSNLKKIEVQKESKGNGVEIASLRIPRLGSKWQTKIVYGVAQRHLTKAVGQYPGTSAPGQIGNFAVAGHRVTQTRPFFNLDKIQNGDVIAVQVAEKIYLYKVTSRKIVKPTEVSVIYPVPGSLNLNPDQAMLTLTTCNPKYSARERLVVQAVLSSTLDAASAPKRFRSLD